MRVLVVLALLPFLVLPAFAAGDDLSERTTIARQILAIEETDDAVNAMADANWPAIVENLKATGRMPDEATLTKLKQIHAEQLRRAIDSSLDDSAAAYAKEFTLSELQTLLAFCQSDVGKKFIAARPAMTRELMPALMAKYRAGFRAAMKQLLNEGRHQGPSA